MNTIKFDTLDKNGIESNVKIVNATVFKACPHTIFDFSHYRPDGTCKCNDKSHKEMKELGYTWNVKTKMWE